MNWGKGAREHAGLFWVAGTVAGLSSARPIGTKRGGRACRLGACHIEPARPSGKSASLSDGCCCISCSAARYRRIVACYGRTPVCPAMQSRVRRRSGWGRLTDILKNTHGPNTSLSFHTGRQPDAMALSTVSRAARRGLASSVQQQGARACASTFANVPLGPPDPIFGLTDAFNKVRVCVCRCQYRCRCVWGLVPDHGFLHCKPWDRPTD